MRVARSAFTSFSVPLSGPPFGLRVKILAHLPRTQSQRSAAAVQTIARARGNPKLDAPRLLRHNPPLPTR
jgi:hypothetical protein